MRIKVLEVWPANMKMNLNFFMNEKHILPVGSFIIQLSDAPPTDACQMLKRGLGMDPLEVYNA